jgi:hypothetical protein
MIMGAGKTTVIAPLLSLILADGKLADGRSTKRLVCVCMPPALLDMSRSVMTERFSSPILPRPVITFHFSRQSVPSPEWCEKLRAAKEQSMVLIASPTTIKSVLLKRLELFQMLEDSRAGKERSRKKRSTLMGKVGVFFGPKSEDKEVLKKDEAARRAQEADACGDILKYFRDGCMLMDEVDILLDPLRSELNWPLGDKLTLDMSDSVKFAAREKFEGFRYKLPFHLLDGILAASSGSLIVPDAFRDSKEPKDILDALKNKIDAGKASHNLQSSPHLVILSRSYYKHELLPLLARWAVLFIKGQVAGVMDTTSLCKLLSQPAAIDEALKQRLCDDKELRSKNVRKMLYLSVQWLHNYLPFILTRIHRVSFGLLDGEDLKKAQRDKFSTKTRQLLAVPFVGKDRPSDAAEFSHPDVLIGFTIMSYRLYGMRKLDVKNLVKVLVAEMKVQNTMKYHRRDACKAYVQMVTQNNGLVRGFTKDGRWIIDLSDEEGQKANAELKEAQKTMPVLWALEMLDLNDPEMMNTVFKMLSNSCHAIQHFLDRYIFVPSQGNLDVNPHQLTASGQELAGPQMFGFCIGFSGTPNNLLPTAMATAYLPTEMMGLCYTN